MLFRSLFGDRETRPSKPPTLQRFSRMLCHAPHLSDTLQHNVSALCYCIATCLISPCRTLKVSWKPSTRSHESVISTLLTQPDPNETRERPLTRAAPTKILRHSPSTDRQRASPCNKLSVRGAHAHRPCPVLASPIVPCHPQPPHLTIILTSRMERPGLECSPRALRWP